MTLYSVLSVNGENFYLDYESGLNFKALLDVYLYIPGKTCQEALPCQDFKFVVSRSTSHSLLCCNSLVDIIRFNWLFVQRCSPHILIPYLSMKLIMKYKMVIMEVGEGRGGEFFDYQRFSILTGHFIGQVGFSYLPCSRQEYGACFGDSIHLERSIVSFFVTEALLRQSYAW